MAGYPSRRSEDRIFKEEFETEAENYVKNIPFVYETSLVQKIVRMFCKITFKDAANFGYNKAKKEYETKLKILTEDRDKLLVENERLEDKVGELSECY